MSTRLVDRVSGALSGRLDRRGFLVRSAMAGSALTVARTDFLLRPMTAYAAICECNGQSCGCGSRCCEGWTAFCCSLPGGENRCPPGTFSAGWWKANGSRYCEGPRYYIDCNAECRCGGSGSFCPECDGHHCHCGNDDCSNWGTACNVFRYGQCHAEVARAGRIVCRVVSCTPPWMIDASCSRVAAQADATANHHHACLDGDHRNPAVRAPAAGAAGAGDGYWVLDRQGGVFAFGSAAFYGSIPGLRAAGQDIPQVRAVALTPTPSQQGYWILDEGGGVFTFGDARFHGSIPGLRRAGRRIPTVDATGLATTPSGSGYWVLDRAGGVFTFGDARFHGSIPGLRQAGRRIPTVDATGLATTPSGSGYWVLDRAGGVFTFGDARFHGSIPGLRQAGQSIGTTDAVAIAATPTGDGYWVLDRAGGVFTFGDARFHGSIPGLRQAGQPIGTTDAVAIAVTPTGEGYWITDATGGVFTFGDASFHGRP